MLFTTVDAKIARRARGENHRAAIGLHHVAVLDERFEGRLVDRQAHQPVAREVQRHFVPRGERDRSEARGDQAFVAHFRRKQRDVSAIGDTSVPSFVTLPADPVLAKV